MSAVNTGGAAFPGLHPSKECQYNDPGMTLRDYFAAKAMQALLSIEGGTLEKDAEVAYKMADAMLKARDG